jgi:hypothetical protein
MESVEISACAHYRATPGSINQCNQEGINLMCLIALLSLMAR